MKRLAALALVFAMTAALGTAACAEAPNDPLYSEQWYLEASNATAIWDYGITGEAVRIGIIDTGMYYGHEDIDYDYVAKGYNYTGGYYDADNVYIGYDNTADTQGHGTRVASVICAKRNNGLGFAGILDKATIVPFNVPPLCMGARSMSRAIKEAVDIYGCDVLNISIGSNYSEEDAKLVDEAVNYVSAKGAIVIAGVGNDGDATLNYPAALDNVIGVGASERDGSVCDFSNHNATVFVLAPGRDICTATMDGSDTYKTGSGTSVSTPQVTALAAAAKSVKPDLTVDEFKQLLKATSVDSGESGWDEYYGWGVIDCKAFLNALNEVVGFYDISDHWARQSIEYVVGKSLFDGVSEHTFAPDREMTRAMLVTVLGRLFENSGSVIEITDKSMFTDVAQGDWYAKYVLWASENGIIEGYGNGSFGPNDNITREQLVTTLGRFAAFTGANITVSGSLAIFADADSISPWARDAMVWAVERDLINGVEADGNMCLMPGSGATRAQVAAIVERYCGVYSSTNCMFCRQ